MSEANLEIVQRIYAEYAHDPDAVRDDYAPDFEFDVAETGPDIGIVAGFDAATEAMRPYFDSFDDFRMEIDEVLHADDRNLVVAMHDTGRMHGSDFEVTNHRFHVWTFREGKVIRFSAHLDRDRALDAAGLSEKAMSQENVEIALAAVDAWNRGDREAFLALWDEEAEFYPLRAQLEGESYTGHDGLMRFLAEMTEDFEQVRFEIEETRDAGEKVVGIGRFRARGRASGVDINVPMGAVQRVRRGKLVYVRFFSEPAEALKAAGLSE